MTMAEPIFDDESQGKLKRILKRIVSMLTRLIARGDVVREDSAEYNADVEYEYRDAEYEIQTKTQTRLTIHD